MKKEYNFILRIIIAFLIPYSLLSLLITPLTMYLSYFILKLFGENILLLPPLILINETIVKFIPACAAISAYYLLMLLVLLTKDIKPLIRLKMFFLGSLLILLINTFRIILLLIILSHYNYNLFESVHMLFWTLIGSLFVAVIWIFLVKRYSVKSVPIFSDLNYLLQQTKLYKYLKHKGKYGDKGKHRGNRHRRA